VGKITVLSDSGEAFRDRKEAGRLLGAALQNLKGARTLVLGIPRGGVVIAREAAHLLKADLDIVLSRKLGAPHNPELAIGSISEDGNIFLDDSIVSHTGADKAYIEKEAAHQSDEIKRRAKIFRKILPKTSLEGKTVIIVDDGLATGATMRSSLWAARREKSSRLIAAVPVASREAVDRTADHCDEIICLKCPDLFEAVGQFYISFDQTTDDAVADMLKEEFTKRGGRV
jgi:predicted phosphoribosyltransferase